MEKNIPTIIIPNSMMENEALFEQAVDEISKARRLVMKNLWLQG
jgi:hypothetical protein